MPKILRKLPTLFHKTKSDKLSNVNKKIGAEFPTHLMASGGKTAIMQAVTCPSQLSTDFLFNSPRNFHCYGINKLTTIFHGVHVHSYRCGRRGGLMVGALDSRSRVRVRASAVNSIVFLGKTLTVPLFPRCINGYRRIYCWG